MTIEIRHVKDAEHEAVAALIVDAYAEFAVSMSPDAWSMFAQDIANVHGRLTDGEIIVALLDDELAGTMTVYRNWRGAQADTLALRLLAVPPQTRGLGVGSALLDWALETARDAGKSRVVMTAMQQMDRMREIADKRGFTRAPELDHEPAPGVRMEGYALDLSS